MFRYFATAFISAAALLSFSAVRADAPVPINLNFPATDGMSVSDCLKVVAMETGEVVLPDASVNGSVGAIHITENSVPDVLNALKTYEPGLTWQIIYYPAPSNEPSGEDLYKGIQLLQGLNLDGLIVPPSGDEKMMLSFKKQSYTNAQQEQTNEAGFKKYYLVSDTTQRAIIVKNAKAPTLAPGLLLDKPARFAATLSDMQGQIAQMNPQQQVQALNAMAATSHQMMQTLSPQAAATLRAQNAGHQTLPDVNGQPPVSK
jgi:hypothetical protein